ncbi:universal stress protein [Streptomyces sp. NPDC047315]|uniref:universal stress protein n=1 Tax=Streptomyces sp. NPDC047315 TaxID=3155142 RepID=UPI0033DB8D3F
MVGSHGCGAFTGMLLGSVSTHCVHHARCPSGAGRTRSEWWPHGNASGRRVLSGTGSLPARCSGGWRGARATVWSHGPTPRSGSGTEVLGSGPVGGAVQSACG